MGLGDMKLMAGIGALTGPVGVLWTLFIGSIFGSIVGVGMRIFGKVGKLQEIPFGPYLAAGMVIYVNFSCWLKSLLI
jgi:prepilin signal peptidase PulO-like enzyme (type II secretory pathway)